MQYIPESIEVAADRLESLAHRISLMHEFLYGTSIPNELPPSPTNSITAAVPAGVIPRTSSDLDLLRSRLDEVFFKVDALEQSMGMSEVVVAKAPR